MANNTSVDIKWFIEDRGGDIELLKELWDIFLQDTPGKLSGFEKGLDNMNLDSVSKIAHAFKSGSATIGALRLSDIAFEMEKSAKENDLDKCKELLLDIKQEINNVIMFITSYKE